MLVTISYNRKNTVDYAAKWALGRNPRYYDYHDIGGDCTNFASQCIYAGSKVMNYTPTYGWYYNSANDKSPSWTGVQYLYNFLVNNKTVGPFGKEVPIRQIQVGDLIQLGNHNNHFYHSLIVMQTGKEPDYSNIKISTHTYDSSYRPLSTYSFEKIRFIHIDGVRKYQ